MSEPDVDGDLCALDGKTVEIAGDTWSIVLYAAQRIDTRQWVQLLLVGQPTFDLTLRLPRTADEIDVLWIITQWLAQPDHRTESVVGVRRVEPPAEPT